MADFNFRKFETFDLKEGEEFIQSVEDNNYNHDKSEAEEFLVGYRTGAKNTLTGKREFKMRLLEARGIYYNTTDYWSRHNCVPKAGDIYIYSDAIVTDKNGNIIRTPQMKIGTGNAYLTELRFVSQDVSNELKQHINDNNRHLNPGEREFWNNKINIDPDNAVADEVLLLNRK